MWQEVKTDGTCHVAQTACCRPATNGSLNKFMRHGARTIRFRGIGTMVRLKPGQRRLLVAHIPPLANLAAGSLLFGQFLSGRPYSMMVALFGIGTWFVLFGVAFYLAAGSDL